MIAVFTFDIFTLFCNTVESLFSFQQLFHEWSTNNHLETIDNCFTFGSVTHVAKSLPFLFDTIFTSYFADKSNVPKVLTNSKGKKRVPGSRDLGQAVKTSDDKFLDFIKRCLE